jgi:lysozyme family protein
LLLEDLERDKFDNMANAKHHIAQVVKEEGGYQAGAADAGNYWTNPKTKAKELLGTKYGITPAAYFAYYKKTPDRDTIKNLTVEQAVPIYKINYWDKIRGDEIANDSVAALMMFAVVNSGVGQIKPLKQLMNAVAGKKIVEENTKPFTSAEIKLLNGLPQDRYFKLLKAAREQFYRNLVSKRPSNQVYLKGWLNRLNKHVYSGASSSGGSALMPCTSTLAIGAGSLLAGYLLGKYAL